MGTRPGGAWATEAPRRPWPDLLALGAAVVLPVMGAVCKVVINPGWAVLAFLLWSPVIIAVWCAGLVVMVRTLRQRSLARDARGDLPGRYRALSWAWSASLFLPGFVMLDGGDAPPLRSPLLDLAGLEPAAWYDTFQDVVLVLCATAAVALPVAVSALARRDARAATSPGAGQNRR